LRTPSRGGVTPKSGQLKRNVQSIEASQAAPSEQTRQEMHQNVDESLKSDLPNQQMQRDADKGVATRNSGDSGYVADEPKPGASAHPPLPLSSQSAPSFVICGLVRRKMTAPKSLLPTWRDVSSSSVKVFPPPAAPPYMAISAALDRKICCGPDYGPMIVDSEQPQA
jgi:hypothetical protein